MSYSAQAAEELALRALTHIAGQPELVSAFLANSGMEPDQLREAARSPEFHQYLLDFILEDDRRVLDFAQSLGLRPEEVLAACTAIAGPGSYGWEAD